MPNRCVWERVVELSNTTFEVTSGLDLPRGDYWLTTVTVCLKQANERLNSVRILLKHGHVEGAMILTRSLFELAANVTYIARQVPTRLPEYLRHGGIPTTEEEAAKLQQELEPTGEVEAEGAIPVSPWQRLRDMCADLGSEWLKEYETFYRYASVPTHSGSFTLGTNYLELLRRERPTAREKAKVLCTALAFHLRVARVVADVFPAHVKPGDIENLTSDMNGVGQALART